MQGVSRAEGLAKHRLGFVLGFGLELEECAYHSLDQRRHSLSLSLTLSVCVCLSVWERSPCRSGTSDSADPEEIADQTSAYRRVQKASARAALTIVSRGWR